MGGWPSGWDSLLRPARAAKEPPAPVMDTATLGQLNIDLASAERDFWKSAPERRREAEKADPAPGSQEEIDAVERAMNLAKNRLDGFLETTRFDARIYQVESGALMGRALTDTRLFLEGQRPEYERLHREFKELKTRHETLLAARRLRDRERPTPVETEPSPKMVASLDGYFFGL